MTPLLVRALISGLLIAIIAMVARKSPNLGGLIASIPLVSTLGMIWLWRDTQSSEVVATYSIAAFIYFLPTIPMFLIIPWMLRQGIGFWTALGAGLATTMILYLVTSRIAASMGMEL
ncbi:MAG: hypothetical protein DI569_13125 [Sphingopyxis macrogoltabida]|uniref:DUF3147 family protein n=1 Tax=Sphingopyxis macrogoltabida TaxID=33050 RepID=A0A2W5KYN1_SPHMC|nr:MAG: hypothetical protein DI569_13125 [Sphingopyxis macrogoltabida]